MHVRSKDYGLKINTNKSKVLIIEKGGKHSPTITVGTNILECVPEFVYLGILITKNNDCSVEISRRINLASQRLEMLKTMWSSSDLSIKTKVDVLISCVFSRLLYAAET